MKSKIMLLLIIIALVAIFEQCKNKDFQSVEYSDIVLMPTIDSLFDKFSEGLNLTDSVSIFIILKNIDANSLKIYLIAKKPLRSDFEFIGIPVTTIKKSGRNVYFFTGLEKITIQDTIFWENHIEIYDDRSKQLGGLHEAPIIKKEYYLLEDKKLQRMQPFDDMIFVGNPVDTIIFR